MAITYKLRPEYASFGGGTVGFGQANVLFDVGAALTAGAGSIVVTTTELVYALDRYAPLFRFSDDGAPLTQALEQRFRSVSVGKEALTTDSVFEVQRTNEAFPRYQVLCDGTVNVGDGTAAPTPVVVGSAPTGAAGGVLGGTYPNPSFAVDMATQAELNAVAANPTIANGYITAVMCAADVATQAEIDPVLTDRVEWLKTQEKFGVGIAAALGGVAPGVAGIQRAMSGVIEIFADVANDLRLTITPAKDCWWEVGALAIAIATDAAWVRTDWWVQLTGTDVRGRSQGMVEILAHGNGGGWITARPTARFKLASGNTYTARLMSIVGSGTGWSYWTGGDYLGVHGKVVGFW